ncbi:MAG: hypothetical protein KatS3mg051_2221 [Anaerolineae bacterium]|nr:MAG: hypothetical protein KatS3mg051_2221 [Anaerolineae bacterium]
MRMIAGVGILRQIVEMTCLREGVAVVRAPAQYTTLDCHLDGTRDRFDAIEEISHRWPCGHVWDQDFNAAENLRRYGERWLTEQAP